MPAYAAAIDQAENLLERGGSVDEEVDFEFGAISAGAGTPGGLFETAFLRLGVCPISRSGNLRQIRTLVARAAPPQASRRSRARKASARRPKPYSPRQRRTSR
jgi:hypothetical protein